MVTFLRNALFRWLRKHIVLSCIPHSDRNLINQMISKLKKYVSCLALGMTLSICANAQDVMPEKLPTQPRAERIVREVSPIASLQLTKAVEETTKKSITKNTNFGENVVKTALQYLGASYRSGMSGPYAFDCSGFTSYVYRQQNVPILRSSRSQYTQGTPIARISDLKKGDLVFFGGRGGGARSVGHVGIVTDVDPSGNNFSFVHAASSGGVKISDSKEAYYSRRYIGARRIVEN